MSLLDNELLATLLKFLMRVSTCDARFEYSFVIVAPVLSWFLASR